MMNIVRNTLSRDNKYNAIIVLLYEPRPPFLLHSVRDVCAELYHYWLYSRLILRGRSIGMKTFVIPLKITFYWIGTDIVLANNSSVNQKRVPQREEYFFKNYLHLGVIIFLGLQPNNPLLVAFIIPPKEKSLLAKLFCKRFTLNNPNFILYF